MMLRNLALVFVLMAACGYARSEPIPLACAGKMTATVRGVTEDYTLAIKVDLLAKTVTVGDHEAVPIVGGTGRDTVTFGKGFNAYPSGSVNRITGEATVDVMSLTDGRYRFIGVCKLAQKLF